MKLSVMVITYNHEKFIAQALSSILEQRVNFEFEIVVGEDCSTDATREILLDFHCRYPGRITPLLRDPNMGAIRNFVTTLAACRGNYIAFLEGDDYWIDQNKLQKQVEFLDNHPSAAVCCSRVQLLDPNGLAGLGLDTYPTIPCGTYNIEDLLETNFIMTCSAVLRRELIGVLPSWFSKLSLADLPLFALAARYGNIELLGEKMAAYRVHPMSTWSSRSMSARMRESSRMFKALDKHLGYRFTNIIRATVSRGGLNAALMERENGSRLGTGRHVLTCIRNGGWKIPQARRTLAGLAAYALIGSWYKMFSKAKPQGASR